MRGKPFVLHLWEVNYADTSQGRQQGLIPQGWHFGSHQHLLGGTSTRRGAARIEPHMLGLGHSSWEWAGSANGTHHTETVLLNRIEQNVNFV